MSPPQEEPGRGPTLPAVGPALRVAAVSVALVVLALLAWRAAGDGAPAVAGPIRLRWWAVGVVTVVCELSVLHLQTRREAQAVSLSELALVAALFFAAPDSTVVGWTVATVLVSLWRRQTVPKLVFNVALSAAGAAVAVLVFRLVEGAGRDAGHGVDVRGWVAVVLAAVAVSLLDTTAVLSVIALVEGDVGPREVGVEAVRGLATTAITTTLALVAVHAVADTPIAVVPVALGIALLIAGYRSYSALAERHLALERIHRVSRVLSGAPEMEELLTRLLHQTRETLLADRVEVAFIGAEDGEAGGGAALRVGLDPAEGVRRSELPAECREHPVWRRVVEEGAPLLVVRGSRDPDHRSFLAAWRLDDAVVVPLRGDTGIVGAVVAGDRMGEVRSFDEHDLRLLGTICEQAGAALQRGELADRLRHEGEHDGLTGLPNRMLLHRRLAEAASAVRAGTSRGFAVVVVNLADFRSVNEVLGHTVGDHVLREVGERLGRAGVPGDVVARLGADEFALLLTGVHHESAAVEVARRVQDLLHRPIDVGGFDVEAAAWIGVAVCPHHGGDAEVVLQRAELALVAARREKAEVQLYSVAEEPHADPARLVLLGELRQALQADQLALFVQPQADARTGRVTDVEALVRWRHPTRGLVGPGEFIPLAERTGLVHPLTGWMLARAVAAAGAWQPVGAAGAAPGIAVNLSPRSLLDPELTRAVETLLELHRLPPGALTLEITESVVLGDPRRTVAVLERLRALGVRISVDDFGTGYSSMTYLRDLPVDEVKIDQTFVTDLLRRPGDEAIVHSIVTLAGNLGKESVAEGVQDQATWDRLAAMGCTRIQGYHLARPMPHEELAGWLREAPVRTGG